MDLCSELLVLSFWIAAHIFLIRPSERDFCVVEKISIAPQTCRMLHFTFSYSTRPESGQRCHTQTVLHQIDARQTAEIGTAMSSWELLCPLKLTKLTLNSPIQDQLLQRRNKPFASGFPQTSPMQTYSDSFPLKYTLPGHCHCVHT